MSGAAMRIRTLNSIIIILLVACGSSEASQTIAPNSSSISYSGRWGDITINSAPAKVAISGGLRMRLRFTGTSLSMNFDVSTSSNKPEISWAVDGGAWSRQAVSSSTISLASGKSDSVHTLDLWVEGTEFYNNYRWTSYDGVRITGIVIDNGASLMTWPVPAAGRMLVIGDSIAEGMLLLGSSPNAPQNFSGRQSFGAQVAEQLNLDVWIHAFGGSGFTGTYAPSAVPETDVNYLWKMASIAEDDPVFDIVLIEAGNNDGSANIQTKYETLIDEIRANSPNAHIFCMSLLYPDPAGQAYISAAATAKSATYVNTSSWSYSHPNSSHPDLSGHTAIANYLNPILASSVPSVTYSAGISNFGQGGKMSNPGTASRISNPK